MNNLGSGGGVTVQKALITLIFLGAFFALILPGTGESNRERLALGELVPLLQDNGVQVEGIDLAGWGVLREAGEPRAIWRKLGWEHRLGLSGSRICQIDTGWGLCVNIKKEFGDGTNVLISIQKVEKIVPGNLCYIVVKCSLPGASEGGQAWEKRFRAFLANSFRERGLYVTVRGKFDRRLEPEEQVAWGRAVYRDLGGKPEETVQTERYLNLIGYTPVLPDAVTAGNSRYNLNIALVNSSDTNETRIYLGSPIITSEY